MSCRDAAAMVALAALLAACGPTAGRMTPIPPPVAGSATKVEGVPLRVLAAESFLADIVRGVAGDRAPVVSLVPVGVDPHAFQPTPADLRRVANADILVVNGAGLETFLSDLLTAAGEDKPVIEAAAGIPLRHLDEGTEDEAPQGHAAGDPHLWLDPLLVRRYVANIATGLTAADPDGAATYAANARAYQGELTALDAEIRALLAAVPAERRLLVTNHESLGYFADRYDLRVVGAVVPGFSTSAEPSARQLAQLVDQIVATGTPAIFLESGVNPQLARQLALETGVRVVTDLHTESLTGADGPAPGYLSMMRHNARVIATGLAGER